MKVLRTPTKKSVRLSGLWAEIWIQDLSNSKQEWQPLGPKFGLNNIFAYVYVMLRAAVAQAV
jgi:hypothetical protein